MAKKRMTESQKLKRKVEKETIFEGCIIKTRELNRTRSQRSFNSSYKRDRRNKSKKFKRRIRTVLARYKAQRED